MAETETQSSQHSAVREGTTTSRASILEKFAVPLIILLHLALSLVLAYKLNIWMDEAFSLHTTDKGFRYALSQALNFELQAPLYFVCLSLWRKLNSSIFFARLFSVICVVLTLKVAATLSRRLFKDVHPGWIVAALAFNTMTITVAVDVRLYALSLLLSALLLLTFYDGYLAETRNRRAQVLYIVLAVASLYTQYYIGFLLAANAAALLVLKRWRPLLEYLVSMVITALCFAPMVPFVRYQMAAHTALKFKDESVLESLKFVTWRMKDYLLPPSWDISLLVRSWFLRFCYLAAIVIVIKKRRNLTPEIIALWTITLVLALFFLFTARWSGQELLTTRHTVIMLLPVTFAAYSIISLASMKRFALIWTLIVLAFSLTSLYVRFKPMAKPGDWQRVASYLMAEEKPEQTILIFHAGAALPLERYYKGRNVLAPVPRANTFERFDFHDYVLRDEREIVSVLERVSGRKERIWLVTDDDCGFADLSYHCEILEDFINRNYAVEDKKSFHHSTVRLLRQKQGR